MTERNRDELLERLRRDMYPTEGVSLPERVRTMERAMFYNPETREPGLVKDVHDLNNTVTQFRASLRTLNWILGILGAIAAVGLGILTRFLTGLS